MSDASKCNMKCDHYWIRQDESWEFCARTPCTAARRNVVIKKFSGCPETGLHTDLIPCPACPPNIMRRFGHDELKEDTVKEKKFWIAWPGSLTDPTVPRYVRQEAAEQEADRIAKENPDLDVYVLAAVAKYRTVKTVREELT